MPYYRPGVYNQIETLRSANRLSIRTIAVQLKISKRCVEKALLRTRKNGSATPRTTKGMMHADRILSPRLLQVLRFLYEIDSNMYHDEARNQLQQFSSKPISLCTLGRGMKTMNITRKVVSTKGHVHGHGQRDACWIGT